MILCVIFIRDSVQIALRRHCLMESCIEYNYLRSCCRHYLLAGSECKSVCVVVNRSKITKLVNLVYDLICYKASLREYLCTLHDPVTNSADLIHRVDDLCFACCKDIYQLFKCFCVCRKVTVSLELSAVACLCAYMTADADPVAVALCDYRLVCHIKKLIFQ